MHLFNDEQLRTLTAAIDRIIPRDDFPSASEAGCADFLIRLIPLEHQEVQYLAGLKGLQAEAQQRGGDFADLEPAAQDSILTELQNGKTSVQWDVDPSDFVRTLASQTVEGYYSDPGNGGNNDRISWKMIGFEVRG